MVKISVIVPVYNAEKYIEKCLESIINQTIGKENLEIVIVNDGSTDKSDKIIQEYARKYPIEIKYYSKENTGVADTRNYAISKATGEYIAFVDSDDYIDKNLYKNIFKEDNIDKNEVIKYKAIRVNENEDIIEKFEGPVFKDENGEEAFNQLYKSDKMIDALWVYLFKRTFFVNNKFSFIPGLYHEDFGLIPLIILKAKNITSLDLYGYYNVQTEQESITRNSTTIDKRAMDLLEQYDNMIKEIKTYDISQQSKENVKIYFTNCIILEINNLKNEKSKNSYIKEIRKRKMARNIKARNFKQLLKKILLYINIKWYLKLR